MMGQKVLIAICLLSCLIGSAVAVKANHNQDNFGIFEIVDCKTAGSKSMPLEKHDGEKQTYCIASKPLVNRAHLKSVRSSRDSFDRPTLLVNLTDEGAGIMEQATERLLYKRASDSPLPALAIVFQGKLVSVPTVYSVIKDALAIQGLTEKMVDEITESLGGYQEKPQKQRETRGTASTE